MHVGGLREFGGITPGHADQRDAEALDQGQQREDLVRTAAVRQGDHTVARGDHAHVAMGGFAGMHKKSRRARAGQRGGNFACDMSAFAHASHHHAASCAKDVPTGGCKGWAQCAAQRGHCVGLHGDGPLRRVDEKLISVVGHVLPFQDSVRERERASRNKRCRGTVATTLFLAPTCWTRTPHSNATALRGQGPES